ncbi:MAG: hypothetical protein HS126_15230 [Anaerolineales bacterium]|nr:hypothetical protein [Anaerolineales bacterium]
MILYPKMTSQYDNIAQWLQEGILAAKAGQVEQARFRLLDVVEQDQTNEAAWFWLYQVFDRPDDKQVCLENLLIINPDNQWARQELFHYASPADSLAFEPQSIAARNGKPAAKQKSKASSRADRPLVLKIITAFWVGISLIFLSGGIIASGEWLASTIRSRNFPHYLTGGQVFELLVVLLFVVVGLVGLNVALALFLRSMIGFYGSLLLALGLLLVGPTISLIASPPNYVVMICTGGMAGMVVLLTLASQPGFKDT